MGRLNSLVERLSLTSRHAHDFYKPYDNEGAQPTAREASASHNSDGIQKNPNGVTDRPQAKRKRNWQTLAE